jgi:sialidase-1
VGRLVIPNDHRGPLGEGDAKYSHAFFSDDHGSTWTLGGTVAPHTDECQVVELADGTLMMNMRNYWERDGGEPAKGRKRAIASSGDGGETWSELSFDDTLIEPVCQASFTRYSWPGENAKNRLLFSNPASTEARVKMTVRLSYDEGKTWPIAKLLHEGPAAYSCLAALPDRQIGCLYERGAEHSYETISFARFTLRWLSAGTDATGA